MTDNIANPVGRPPKYTDPEVMQEQIDLYFKTEVGQDVMYDREGKQINDKNGEPIMKTFPPTVSGLALFLGFCDRNSLYDYKQNEQFSRTVKRAIARIERFAEDQLFTSGKPTGAIFWMKNHGWTDKQEIESNITIKNKSDLEKLPDDELRRIAEGS
jgi:hypothetical protein